MRLRHVHIENFRSFGQADFDLSTPDGEGTQDVALLVGPSGTGKTAFLDAVAGLFGALAKQPGDDIYQAEELHLSDIRQGADRAVIALGWHDMVEGQQRELSCHSVLAPRSVAQPKEMVRLHEWDDIYISSNNITSDFVLWQKSLYHREGTSGLLVSFPSYRFLPQQRLRGPDMDAVIHHRCWGSLAPLDHELASEVGDDMEPRADQLKQWLINVEYAALRAGKRQRPFPLWDQLIAALDRALAPCRFAEIDDNNEVRIQTPTGTLPVEALSAGYKSLFIIVTEMALRLSLAASEQDPFTGEAVCLIDEIDAHLDPALQERVLPDLRSIFPNVQFIATTHSAAVAGSVRRDQIFVLGEE